MAVLIHPRASGLMVLVGVVVSACGGSKPSPPGTGGRAGSTGSAGEAGEAGAAVTEVGGAAGEAQAGMSGAGRGGQGGHGGRGGAGNAGAGAIAGEAGSGTGGEGATGASAGTGGHAGGGFAGTGGQLDPCAANNGGCDPLTKCVKSGSTRTCSACPSGYSGTGETGCTPKLCDGAPDGDCACIRVTLDGDDAAAIASNGARPFHDVQLALDFASEHPEVASKVCVVGGTDCTSEVTYRGPEGGDFTMHDGVSLYGSYESTSFTRCLGQPGTFGPTTLLALTSPAGVVFPSTVAHPTEMDGFAVFHFAAPTSTAFSVRGAKGVALSSIRIEDGDGAAVDLYGVDVSDGGQATVRDVTVLVGPTRLFPMAPLPLGRVYGIRAVASQVAVDSCALTLTGGVDVYGVWLEDTAGAVVQDSTITARHSAGAIAGFHVEGASADLSGNNVLIDETDNGVVAEIIDAPDVTFSAQGSIYGDGLRVLRSKVSASLNLTIHQGTGVLLDTSPGSRISVGVTGSPTAVVRVVGDATGTTIGVGADVHTGWKGIELSDCGGAAPLITGSSLRIQGAGDPVEAISSFGDCHPRIENNPKIVSVAWHETNPNAIHCGNGSLCTIRGNADIHVEVEDSGYPRAYNLAGIRCEPGSCGDIVGNRVSGLWISDGNMSQGYWGVEGYGIVSGGGLIARNLVSAGCAATGAGLRAPGGRIENNFVGGPGCFSTHNGNTTGAALDITGPADVHSNTLFGSAADFFGGSCDAAAVRDHYGASFRNNIMTRTGNCAGGDFTGATPQVFENNDLAGPSDLAGTTSIGAINALAPSGNFSAPPGFSTDNKHLAANSVCIGAGTAEGAPSDDFDGDPRDANPDVGADEWNGTTPPNPCIGACSGHGTCQVSNDLAVCTCYPGYLEPDCSSLDLCVTNHGGCDPLTTCTGFPGGRTCGPCPPDYTGTGETGCTPVGCAGAPCPVAADCTPTPGGGHTCTCRPGVTGDECQLYFTALEAGDYFTCGLRTDGQIICFGRDDRGQTDVPPGTYTSLSVGRNDACAVRTDGTLACWGDSGQVVASPPSGTFWNVYVGDNYACAIYNYALTCWGALPPPPSGWFKTVEIGDWHACGIQQDGSVVCWGLEGMVPDYGQATPPTGSFRALGLNGTTSCGVTSDGAPYGALVCWGADVGGASPPSGMFSGGIQLGASSGCAVGEDGGVHCWGSDQAITNAPPGDRTQQLTVGGYHACAINNYSPRCWGDNTYGELTLPY